MLTAGKTTEVKLPDLEDIHVRVTSLKEQAILIEGLLNTFLNKVKGEPVTTEKGSSPRPVPNGLMGQVNEEINYLGFALNRIGEAASRLQQIA